MINRNEAYNIINTAYRKTGAKDKEYSGLCMPDFNNSMPTSLLSMLGITDRKFIRFTSKEVNQLVLFYRENEEELILTAIFENYINMIANVAKRYQDKASSIKRGSYNGSSYSYDDDFLSEAMIILDKCLKKFVIYDDERVSSFGSFFIGELRNHLIETCRKQYFDVLKIPSTVYKEYRKTILNSDTVIPQNELGMFQRTHACISECDETMNIIDESFQEESGLYFSDDSVDTQTHINTMLKSAIGDVKDYDIFCMAYGIGRDKLTGVKIAEIYGVSKPAISKRLKRVRDKLKKHKEIKDLYRYYKERNILVNFEDVEA